MTWKEFFKELSIWIEDIIVNVFHDPIETKPHDLPMNQPDPIVPPKSVAVPPPVVVPTVVSKATLENFCLAIRDFEGAPGDRNYRNNNPGNCRYSSVGYASFYGHVGKDKDNFAIFKDYATGWLYLKNLVLSKVRKNPNQTIVDFMRVYAPSSDNNDPAHYAVYIARRLGVKADYPMKLIV